MSQLVFLDGSIGSPDPLPIEVGRGTVDRFLTPLLLRL